MKSAGKNRKAKRLIGMLLAAAMAFTSLPSFVLPVAAAEETARTITISFRSNGGTGEMESIRVALPEQSKMWSFSYQLPVCTFQKEGYKFLGWTTSSTDNTVYLPDYGNYRYTTDMTLYAVWGRDDEVCRISFDTAGAMGQPDLYAKKNSTTYLPKPLYGKDNATFDIYVDEATDQGYNGGASISVGEEDIRLKIRWYTTDISIVSPALEFANTTQWAKGLYRHEYGDNNYIVWNLNEPYLGWADTNQDPFPYCYFVAGLNGVHWWFDRNEDFVRYYTPFTEMNIDPQYRGEYKSDLWEYFKWHAGYRMTAVAKTNAAQWWIPGDYIKASPDEVRGNDKSHAYGGFFNDIFGVVGTNHSMTGHVTKRVFTEYVLDGLKNDKTFYTQMGENFDGHAWTIWGFHFDSEGYVDGIYMCESNGADVPGDSVAEPRKVIYDEGAVKIKSPLRVGEMDAGGKILDISSLPASRKVWNDYYLGKGSHYLTMPETSESRIPPAGQERTAGEFDLPFLLNNRSYGTIKLGKDVSVSEDATFTISRSVTLDLNGHTIKGKYGKPVLTVTGGKDHAKIDVVIKDSSGGKGKITGGHGTAEGTGGVLVSGNNTHLFFEGGNITENRGMYGGGIYVENGATVTMDGGRITNNKADTCTRAGLGGGVYVSGGSFVMNGGEISGNYSNSAGGGVAVGVCGKFIMNDGKITGNKTELDYSADIYGGGGVAAYAVGGQVKLLGGEITENEAKGGASYGGGVLATYGGSVTVGNNVKISGNKENGRVCNVLVDGNYKESYLKTENLSAEEKIGVTLKGDQTGRFLADAESETIGSSYFVSDNENYVVSGNEITAEEDYYSLAFNKDQLTVMYSMGVSVPVTVLKNGIPCKLEGTVTLETNGKSAAASVGEDGVANVMASPMLGEFNWKIGKNRAKLVWKDQNGVELHSEDVEFTYTRYCIEPQCIIWENVEGRMEGDGKYLTTSFKTSNTPSGRKHCIPETDLDKVKLVLEGHRAQEAGTYVAKVVGIAGEKADYYELEPNTWGTCFQVEYTIEARENQYAMTLSPEEKKVEVGEEVNMDVTVKKGGEYCSDGTVSLRIGGTELCTTKLKKGVARFTFKATKNDLPVGRNTVTAYYIPEGQNDSAASVESVVEMLESQLPRLEWDGELKLSGPYGKTLWMLTLDTGDKTPTYQGEAVRGTWRFRASQENIIPDCTGNQAYEVVFQPAPGQGKFAELSVMVVPEVEKMGQMVAPYIYKNQNLKIGSTSVVLDYDNDRFMTGKGGAPLQYALLPGAKTLSSVEEWQSSPVFSGLTPNTQYTIFARYAETDNYKVGTASDYVFTTAAADSEALVAEVYPIAEGVYGQKLGDISLRNGKVTKGGQTVEGSWTWDDETKVPAVGAKKSYGITFTANDGGETLSASIFPVIQKKTQSCEEPKLLDKTVSWIELEAVERGESEEAVMYGIVPKGYNGLDKAIWQKEPRFTGLDAGTGYEFFVKRPGNENYEDGISVSATFSTVERGTTTLAVNENVTLKKGKLEAAHLVTEAKYGSADAMSRVSFRWKSDQTTQQEWEEGLPLEEGTYRVRIMLPDYEDEEAEIYYVGQSTEVLVRLGGDDLEPVEPVKPDNPDNPEKITKGDVNGDGRVDLLDLRMMLRHICKKETLEPDALKNANLVGEEEEIDLLDLRALLREICGKTK